MRNLHDIAAPSEGEIWRSVLRRFHEAPLFIDRGWHDDPLDQRVWNGGTLREAHTILGELELAAENLRRARLDRYPHIALEIGRREMYVLRANLPITTLNNLFPEGTVLQFRGIPLMLR